MKTSNIIRSRENKIEKWASEHNVKIIHALSFDDDGGVVVNNSDISIQIPEPENNYTFNITVDYKLYIDEEKYRDKPFYIRFVDYEYKSKNKKNKKEHYYVTYKNDINAKQYTYNNIDNLLIYTIKKNLN
jgi:hypothetical protein